jgi:hypothetical protein
MKTSYTYSEARQNLSAILDYAGKVGEVRISRRNGQVFVIRPEKSTQSPLDVQGVNLGLDAGQIVHAIREGRYTGKSNPEPGNDSTGLE